MQIIYEYSKRAVNTHVLTYKLLLFSLKDNINDIDKLNVYNLSKDQFINIYKSVKKRIDNDK